MNTNLILALLAGMGLVLFLILKTKVQAFPALLLASVTVGLVSRMPTSEIMGSISDGFGSTLSSIGIIIGLGVMMGKILEVTGAAKKMAVTILNVVGEENTEWVLMLSGWLVSIPVFCDSGFVILSELAKEFSRNTKKSMIALGGALGIGLYLTHYFVPPTPGPLGVAGILGVDVGQMLLFGILVSALSMIPTMVYIKYINKKLDPIIPEESEELIVFLENVEELPSAFLSFLPIVAPILLILSNTVLSSLGRTNPVVDLVGNPIMAVLIGLLLSVYTLTKNRSVDEVVKILEGSLSDAGLILCITGAGGALGAILRVSGVGEHVAQLIAGTSFPAIFVPMLMAALLKISQGSGTVAVITTASILAPMIDTLGISPLITALAISGGGMIASFISDSYFWVVTRFSGMDVDTGTKAWTSISAVSGLSACIIVYILGLFF